MAPDIPARAWFRPAALAVGALALTVVLGTIGLWLGAILVFVAGLFMSYWTSPLRRGPHENFLDARAAQQRRGGAVIVWAPGDPLSARLLTALREKRSDVSWVNVYYDRQARAALEQNGGLSALPLVLVGEETVLSSATVAQVLEALPPAAPSPEGDGATA